MPGLFYGIGTVLGASNDKTAQCNIVFGSGSGYDGVPAIDLRWKVYFVRGPVTAAELPGTAWITDPGILMAKFFHRLKPTFDCSFMSRWNNWTSDLETACAKVGIHVIDPRADVEKVTEEIASSKLLLTEALHGAVVADTLRTPWISIYGDRGHEFKWYDWCGSMGIVWNPIDMVEYTLTWARRYAVPQLSAPSVHAQRLANVEAALACLNQDIEKGVS